MVQDAQKCDAMRWTTCWPLARSSDRWIEVVICCDMDYENEHDGDHGLNEGANSFQDACAGVMYADPDRNWRRRSPLTRPLRCLELDWEVWQLTIACTLTLVDPNNCTLTRFIPKNPSGNEHSIFLARFCFVRTCWYQPDSACAGTFECRTWCKAQQQELWASTPLSCRCGLVRCFTCTWTIP
jgi:hypothetical protein